MIQSALEGMEHELLGMYGGECMMRNIPDLSGKIEKMFFFCGEVGTGGAENFPTCREPRIKMYTFVRLDLEG